VNSNIYQHNSAATISNAAKFKKQKRFLVAAQLALLQIAKTLIRRAFELCDRELQKSIF